MGQPPVRAQLNPPPPPDVHPDNRDFGNLPEGNSATQPDVLQGQWVTSFSGLTLFDPLPKLNDPAQTPTETAAAFLARVANLPPLIGGYSWKPPTQTNPDGTFTILNGPGSYEQCEGYFAFAALACITFDGFGKLSGTRKFNRGAAGGRSNRGYRESTFTGSYTVEAIEPNHIWEGTIQTIHDNEGGAAVEQNWVFAMTDANRLEWLFATASERPYVAQGTLTRVINAPRRQPVDHSDVVVTPDLPVPPS